MATRNREIDPTETPLDPDVTQIEPPLSGTVDDDDDMDDERWDENEPPERWVKDTNPTRDELRPGGGPQDIEQEGLDEDSEDEEVGGEDSE
jgi:hypothetical protein